MRKRKIILDALRGLAGLCVVLFHLSESFGWEEPGRVTPEQVCGHGYLAVEFFLLLMGYMLGFAYDRRWTEGMGLWDFAKRRLKRLHPYVLSGLVLGILVTVAQGLDFPYWCAWIRKESAVSVVGTVVAGAVLFPAFWTVALAPFNACSWTLYFEYVGNFLYATVVRRLGTVALAVCTALALAFSVWFVFGLDLNGWLGTSVPLFDRVAKSTVCALHGGYGTGTYQYVAGFARLLFPFFLGLLLFRLGWKIVLPGKVALPLSVILFLAVLFAPGSYTLLMPSVPWANGLFDLAAVGLVFPVLILIGVGTDVSNVRIEKTSVFLAELSYPLYMSHYPLIYIHAWWVRNYSTVWSMPTVLGLCALEFVLMLLLSYGIMKFWERMCFK